MKKYNIVNNLTGWLCFIVAAVTYLLTVEPTASFWDCPEFIVQGTKLEVGHPPGNPIFMLTARFFVTLFGGAMSTAALAVNCMSALLSAATILLMFWSITHLARRLMVRDGVAPGTWQTVIIMAAGLCGSLAYTWSDTFWFSAVEGEVYAFSSFCTALVFWLMLKWENRADHPDSDRYLVLIAYVIGVSIAVHLLNLLCIPALGLIYYYRRSSSVSAKGSLIALAISCVLVGAILYGLVPGFVQVAQWFELLFVNALGTGYNTGVLFYTVLLVAVFIAALLAIYRGNDLAARLLTAISLILSGMVFIGHSIVTGLLLGTGVLLVLLFAKKLVGRRLMAMTVLCVMVIFAGYSSYALLLIRASSATPMNQNAPDNVFALASYLNREQYGDRPLFNGPVFAEALLEEEYPQGSGNYYVVVDDNGFPRTRIIDGYMRDENGNAINDMQYSYTRVVKDDSSQPDRYVREVQKPEYKTMGDLNMLLTRIYSGAPEHVPSYKSWAGYRTPDLDMIPASVRSQWAQQGFVPKAELMRYISHMKAVTTREDSRTGQPLMQTMVWKPGFDVSLRYFVNYQLNHMYWRYFLWNFAGRQNDFQGNGEPHLGNWISGIPFIDNMRLGDQSLLPDEFGKANKGQNVFYMLPLLLGVIGLFAQALYRGWASEGRGIEQFWVVFFLFFMTGIAIVLYLNQTPGQPRERDYAFAGSFYAFAMWIGLAIPAIALWLKSLLSKQGRTGRIVAAAVSCAIALGIPLQMVSQSWDDHDRSGRYTTRDFGFNYLSSLDPNAIIFTNGDNDTFPLWYAQEVEGFRTDVRVVNLSYLTTDWYATQQTYPTYEAAPVPMLATPSDWKYERLAFNFILPGNSAPTDVFGSLGELYNSDESAFGAPVMTSPNIFIPVDKDVATAHYGTGNAAFDSAYVAPYAGNVTTNLSSLGAGLNQSKILSLDMIANSVRDGWKRPAYFATTVPTSFYLGLSPFMSSVGMANEVTGIRQGGDYNVTAPKAYRNIVTDYRWGGMDNPDAKLYLDETVRRMAASIRSGIYTVGENLMMLPDAPADSASRAAAVAAGLEAPATQADMARQLFDIIRTKLPASAQPYDGMLGLYLSRAYYDLYRQTGRATDLETARDLAATEAERYAQYIRYGASLHPADLMAVTRAEGYAMSYLAEAVALVNRCDILLAKPEIQTDETLRPLLAQFDSLDITDDWTIAPLIYIQGFTASDLRQQIPLYEHPDDRALLERAVAVLDLHESAGIEPMAFSNDIMSRYGFDADTWTEIHGR